MARQKRALPVSSRQVVIVEAPHAALAGLSSWMRRLRDVSDGIRVVNAEDLLDESGELPMTAPAEAFRNAVRMAQCIEYGGPLPQNHLTLTLILCRRRPDGVPCRGTLIVAKTDREELHAFCASCRADEFLISNWQETLFADGPPGPIPLEPDELAASRALPTAVSEPLTRALTAIGSDLSIPAIQEMIAKANHPGVVMQAVLGQSPPRGMKEAQAFADALIATWNATPRPDLGGKTPEEVFAQGRNRSPVVTPPHVGRNEPCPCGSGRKFKKCCGVSH